MKESFRGCTMEHHTKNKGDLGVLKAQVDLCSKGYLILTPLSEHSPFDIVAYKNGEFIRIQVKYRSVNSKGFIFVRFSSSFSTSKGYSEKPVNKSEIDLYCVFCPDTDKCYYFDPNKFKSTVNIRINKSLNNQCEKINFAEDYLIIPTINKHSLDSIEK